MSLARILDDARALLTDERDWCANMANVAALAFVEWNKLKANQINWLGFYLRRTRDELVLGPFGGNPACIRIKFDRGVCGKAARDRATVVVPDVHEFPGHIACDSRSVSEIVVPVIAPTGQLVGVLDVDCLVASGFDDDDRAFVEALAKLVGDGCDFDFLVSDAE
jgi:L-methionine (R)-S-oxide reductase